MLRDRDYLELICKAVSAQQVPIVLLMKFLTDSEGHRKYAYELMHITSANKEIPFLIITFCAKMDEKIMEFQFLVMHRPFCYFRPNLNPI